MNTIEATSGETIHKLAERAIFTLKLSGEEHCQIIHNGLAVNVYKDSRVGDILEKWDMQRQIQWGHKPWGER